MTNNDSHQHVVKTSEQWNERAVEFWVVPRGCLCVELTSTGKTKIKVGEGNKYYSQLPYITDEIDLSNYYTKEEIDNILSNINRMAIMSTDEYDSKSDLPTTGNKLGDVRFVKSQSPSIKQDPDIYLWNGVAWIYVGYEFKDIDLSQYLKKEEFFSLFNPVQQQVDEMYPKMHEHQNLDLLNRIEEPYTTAEKTKLAGLKNYDAEIESINDDIDSLKEDQHHHDNKEFLDTITEDYQIWSIEDREKFDNIPDYAGVIAEIQYDIQILDEKSHTHGIDGKGTIDILNRIEEPYTTEEKEKLAGLTSYDIFIGTDGMYPGKTGLVPGPKITDIGKFLASDGTWKTIESSSDFIGATDENDGYHGLVPAPLAGDEGKFLRGDGTWTEVDSTTYEAGIGLTLGDVVYHNMNPDLPEEYLQVEYLESTGTQYIEPFVNSLERPFDCEIRYSITEIINDGWTVGIYNPWYGYVRGVAPINGAWYTATGTTYDPNILQTDLIINARFNFDNSYNQFLLFCRGAMEGAASFSKSKIYDVKVYKNNQLIVHLIPCVRKSDNVPGMYDLSDYYHDHSFYVERFYTNLGTGDFLYGDPMVVPEFIDGDTFNVNVGQGLTVDGNNDINVNIGDGLRFDADGAIEVTSIVEDQYVRVSTDDSFVLLHTIPIDWDEYWFNYYELTYDEITTPPENWDPTRHYKYEDDAYVLGSPDDTFISTTWYDKHYIGLDPSTHVPFDSDVYYMGDLQLIEDGENYDTAFSKINSAIEHIERLEQDVQFLADDKIGVRMGNEPSSERVEFYNR